ncbi:unnamed protein product [Blepharisma stoltei]|uniref:Glyoxalase domain-containing protein 4 n=1 Tax=Blepharisma stoltei TaxID=1481888 RepID=A0AAU9K7U0_9CILI|nr:unnamed protein product [Blepharisma stoltei]
MKGVIIFTTNIMRSTGFYTDALGLKCQHLSEVFAEFHDEKGNMIMLRHTDSIAYCNSGFNPVLLFEKRNFDETLANAIKYGAIKDGEPVNSESGKVVYLKSPDGYSFALKEFQEEIQEEKPQKTDTSPVTEELQKLFQKLKI